MRSIVAARDEFQERIFALAADDGLQWDERDAQRGLLHADGRHDAMALCNLAQMLLELHEADGYDGQRLARAAQDLLDERLELERRALPRRADGHNDAAVVRHLLERLILRDITRLVAVKARERVVEAVEVHAREFRLAHGLKDQRRRNHVDRAHRHIEALLQTRAEIAERAHVREYQDALETRHGLQHGCHLVEHGLWTDLERHVDGQHADVRRAEQALRDFDHRRRRALAMRRDDDDDAVVALILLRRFQQQGDVLDLDARHLEAVMLPDEAADLGRHLKAERVLRHSALELFMRCILRLDPLEEGREVQAEGVEEAVVVTRVHALLHVERHLLREVDERGVDDLQQALARCHVDRSFLVVEIAHVDIDVRREDLLDEIAADALSLEKVDLRLDDLVEIELRTARAVRQQKIRPRRHDDARVTAEGFRDLRQGLAVGRERQESTPDLLRQHLEVNLDALRAVNAVEEGLRAEQLDV